MGISVKEVEYLATLARLQLSAEELKQYAPQLDEILSYVEKLKGVSVQSVPPTSHVLELSNVFREDQNSPSLPTETALSNAPEREGPFYKVPRVIEAS